VIRTERSDDGSLVAVSEVTAGVETRTVRVALGRHGRHIDPGGLRNTPVVVVATPSSVTLVRAGAVHAGRASVQVVDQEPTDPLGARLLGGAADAEVIVVVTPASPPVQALIVARALGGRPLPAIPLSEPTRARDMLDGCWVDLDVAVPALEHPRRAEVRRTLDELGLIAGPHHVVEVDPRAALHGRSTVTMSLSELAAAATGVLAGRIAAGNRRWR
jgi:hypothetical protein